MHINTPWDAMEANTAFIMEMIQHPHFTNLLVNRERKSPIWKLYLKGRRPIEAMTLKDLCNRWREFTLGIHL